MLYFHFEWYVNPNTVKEQSTNKDIAFITVVCVCTITCLCCKCVCIFDMIVFIASCIPYFNHRCVMTLMNAAGRIMEAAQPTQSA